MLVVTHNLEAVYCQVYYSNNIFVGHSDDFNKILFDNYFCNDRFEYNILNNNKVSSEKIDSICMINLEKLIDSSKYQKKRENYSINKELYSQSKLNNYSQSHQQLNINDSVEE